jgi:hypothetical protein
VPLSSEFVALTLVCDAWRSKGGALRGKIRGLSLEFQALRSRFAGQTSIF